MRHAIPQQFKDMKQPRMCHNCKHYDEQGICLEFEGEPPEVFANKNNACELWVDEVPF